MKDRACGGGAPLKEWLELLYDLARAEIWLLALGLMILGGVGIE